VARKFLYLVASLVVLAIAALLAGRYLGWQWMDPVMGLVGAVVIARWSWTLMRDTAAVLLDRTDDHVAEEVRELVEAPGDSEITDLHVWRVGSGSYACALALLTHDPDLSPQSVRAALASHGKVAHLTVEIQHCPDCPQ